MKIIAFKQVSYMKLIEAKNDKTDTKTGEYGVFAQTLVRCNAKKKKKDNQKLSNNEKNI